MEKSYLSLDLGIEKFVDFMSLKPVMAFFGLSIAFGVGLMASAIDDAVLRSRNIPNIKERGRQVYETLVDNVENHFRLDYGLRPSLDFRVLNRTTAAMYDDEKDEIVINEEKGFHFDGGRNPFLNFLYGQKSGTLESTTVHELGHAWVERVDTMLRMEGYEIPSSPSIWRVVEDGIAEFFRYDLGVGVEYEIPCGDWPESLSDFHFDPPGIRNPKRYACGHLFVNDVLAELGVTEGVARMLLNPPTEQELIGNNGSYQQRVLAMDAVLNNV